jgi:hypothetical protein
MRLWTLHPKYLDARGLVALWREALLAQAVLLGQTRGYVHHPQLIRFRETSSPIAAIASYLRGVQNEAKQRGYSFDVTRINLAKGAETISTPSGQLDYEWIHLKEKLLVRAPAWLVGIQDISRPDPHPLFRIVQGTVAEWEVIKSAKRPKETQA